MTKQEFWRSASIWGAIVGGGLFLISFCSFKLGLGAEKLGWMPEFLRFVLIAAVIFVTGRRNAALSGPEGYPYGRAVGFIFAMMMFAGVVAGIGEFLMVNFVAREHYDAIYAKMTEGMMQAAQGNAQVLEMVPQMARWMTNPIVLILSGVFTWVAKGGFLGLILAAFVQKKPDIFAANE